MTSITAGTGLSGGTITSSGTIAATGRLADVAGLAVTDSGVIVGDGSNFVLETGGTLRTSLGLGTGDSPQFTAVNIGAASDTTLARSGAGALTVEGNAIYRAGGTDVPVADGGTGASSLTDGGILLGSGTGAITAMSALAKGSIVAGDGATDPVALAVGTNDHVLTADSGETSGLKWAAVSAGPTLGTPLTLSSTANHTWNSSNSGITSSITYFIIHFSQVLTSSGCTIKIQLGTASGIETSGYVSTGLRTSDNNAATATDSMIIHAQDTSDTIEGTFKCYLLNSSSNLWVSDHTLRDGASDAQVGGGKKALSGTLTQVKFVTSTGTLSSGSMHILCG